MYKFLLLMLVFINSVSFAGKNINNKQIENKNFLYVTAFDTTQIDNNVSGRRIVGQFLMSNLGGLVGGLLGMGLGEGASPSSKEGSSGVLIGFVTGFTLGNALGTYLSGNEDYRKGSFLITLFGSIIGTSIATVIVLEGDLEELSTIPYLILPAACSISAYYLLGNNKTKDSALLNFNDNQLKLSNPSFYISKNNILPNDYQFNLNLISIEIP